MARATTTPPTIEGLVAPSSVHDKADVIMNAMDHRNCLRAHRNRGRCTDAWWTKRRTRAGSAGTKKASPSTHTALDEKDDAGGRPPWFFRNVKVRNSHSPTIPPSSDAAERRHTTRIRFLVFPIIPARRMTQTRVWRGNATNPLHLSFYADCSVEFRFCLPVKKAISPPTRRPRPTRLRGMPTAVRMRAVLMPSASSPDEAVPDSAAVLYERTIPAIVPPTPSTRLPANKMAPTMLTFADVLMARPPKAVVFEMLVLPGIRDNPGGQDEAYLMTVV